MLDDLSILQEIETPLEVREGSVVPFNFNGMTFVPRYSLDTKIIRYNARLDNLYLTIQGNQLRISNSWHKYLKGNNYSDYNLTDIEKTFDKLQVNLGGILNNGEIRKISYGCVIEENPYLNFPKWKSYKTKKPVQMHNKGVIYGASFEMTDYKIKGYDKTYEVLKHNKIDLNKNLFRVECEVKSIRHLQKKTERIPVYVIDDLFRPEIIQLLAKDLLSKYRTIEKETLMKTNLSIQELKIVPLMESPEYRDQLRRDHYRTFKRYKRIYEKIIKQSPNEYFEGVERTLQSKLLDLCNS